MSGPHGAAEPTEITVLGCGLMGSALARALAAAGHPVTVWNRTPERAEALAGERMSAERTVAEAVGSARLVVACLADYAATLAAIDPVTDWTGTTLVNLASGAPSEVEEMERRIEGRGGRYLDGAVLAYPDDIGTPGAMIVYLVLARVPPASAGG
ncbi:NAD(P)-binding domain-containing protein [Nocardiopsis metallicus]|uniref:3-hydroxyisobutyrate dehydrogenase-like beta-hydroxyacid dehydrogenase n=1 Tax=Nocardiopsis metallicus TaxID=179819 RepID=A0A840W3T7_9ACTN|nr:NAD(P)-binding domain-containing protein [Nocardiopsis metallicus]MBB5490644.1 3-hydroxyisobutyrate dehydrogenase-like beta-hydroxyacid dehydrogenase [Nocardiopsis metallicus]